MVGSKIDERELESMTTVESDPSAAALPLAGSFARRNRLLVLALLAFAIAVGIGLRFLQIADQIIADDEWHSLHMLLDNDYASIFTHFGVCDHCIPLTLYDKLVSDTVGLSEWSMRAPMLLTGCLALFAAPWLLFEYLGAKNTIVFTWLLAVSPLHIYFSRYARPYSIVFLLLLVGTAAFARWWRTGKARWAILFAACGILSPWFHLACLPFVAAPFACALVLEARRARAEGRPLVTALTRDVRPGFWWLAALVAVCVSALIVPPLATDWTSLAGRTGHHRFRLPPLDDVFSLLSGTHVAPPLFISGLAFLLGVMSMRVKQPVAAACFILVPAAQIVALTISGPDKFEDAIVLVRYAIPMLAAYLWISAVGLEQLDGLIRKEWKRAPAHIATCAMCIALPLFGPIVQFYHDPNNWTNHAMYQFDYTPRFHRAYIATVLNLPSIPPIYFRLGQLSDPDIRIVEAPWRFEWNRNYYPVYQFIHKKKTLIGFVGDRDTPPAPGELPFGDRRFHFHNFVDVGDFAALRRKNVRFVILHRNGAGGGTPDPSDARLAAVERWRREYVECVGKPVFEDDSLSVFDLEPRR
jgi:hypothetical protein